MIPKKLDWLEINTPSIKLANGAKQLTANEVMGSGSWVENSWMILLEQEIAMAIWVLPMNQ